jgi:hypothetical protein
MIQIQNSKQKTLLQLFPPVSSLADQGLRIDCADCFGHWVLNIEIYL